MHSPRSNADDGWGHLLEIATDCADVEGPEAAAHDEPIGRGAVHVRRAPRQ